MDLEKDSLLTTEEVARILHCKTAYIQKLCREKEISYIPIGKRYLFRPEIIKELLKQKEVPPKRKRPY